MVFDELHDIWMTYSLHDGHFVVKLAVDDAIFDKFSFVKLLGSEQLSIGFVGETIDGGKRALAELIDSQVDEARRRLAGRETNRRADKSGS